MGLLIYFSEKYFLLYFKSSTLMLLQQLAPQAILELGIKRHACGSEQHQERK